MYYNSGNENEYDFNPGQNDEDMGMDMNMDMDMRQRNFSRDLELSDDIAKAIIGETQAYYFYEKLADLAMNEHDRQIIQGIQQDEAKHYRWFTTILRQMGEDLPQIPMGELPKDFEDGVKKAIEDELNAVEFYEDIADRATAPNIQRRFLHAAQDEQRHASLYINMLMNMYTQD